MRVIDKIGDIVTAIFMLFFLAFGLFQIVAGFIGIFDAHHWIFAFGALALAFIFRSSLPLLYGVFRFGMDTLDWPWWGALLLAAPGLLLVIPQLAAVALDTIRHSRRKYM